MLICDRSKFFVIPVPRVSGSSTNNQPWFEETGLRNQGFIVDQMRFTMDTVGEGLEVNGRSRHLLFGSLRLI